MYWLCTEYPASVKLVPVRLGMQQWSLSSLACASSEAALPHLCTTCPNSLYLCVFLPLACTDSLPPLFLPWQVKQARLGPDLFTCSQPTSHSVSPSDATACKIFCTDQQPRCLAADNYLTPSAVLRGSSNNSNSITSDSAMLALLLIEV